MKRPYVSPSVELNGKNNTFSRKSIPQGPVGHFANAHTRKSGVDEGNDNQEMNRFTEFNGMQGHEHSCGSVHSKSDVHVDLDDFTSAYMDDLDVITKL